MNSSRKISPGCTAFAGAFLFTLPAIANSSRPTSVVVNNLNFVKLPTLPNEANTVLIVNPDAVLSFPAAAQGFKPVSRRHPQIIQIRRIVDELQLPQGNTLDIGGNAPALSSLVKLFGIRVLETCNHA
jgi:hypothetical protein